MNKIRLFLIAAFITGMIALISTSTSRTPVKPNPLAADASPAHPPATDASTLPTPTDASPTDASTSSTPDLADNIHPSTITVENLTNNDTTVYVAFGSNSVILPPTWAFCTGVGLNCNFPLGKRMLKNLPLDGKYLNATFSFGAPVTCGITKAEININNPTWYDILDVSLVDGYSNKISISAVARIPGSKTIVLGPPKGKEGNEKVLGLFPYGCDVCTARKSPPCGIPKGQLGCKAGTQYKPDVVCQYQGPQMKQGNQKIVVKLEN